MNHKPCTYCGKTDHTSIMCFDKPRKPLQYRPDTRGYQNMEAAYEHWYRENPPDEDNLYYCHYCGKPLTRDPDLLDLGVERVTIDHYHARSSRPDIKFDPSNFVPCCFYDNTQKGSMDGDSYKALLNKRKEENEQIRKRGTYTCGNCGSNDPSHQCRYFG